MDIVLIVTILISLSTFILVVELVRQNKLKEKYSLLWLCASSVLLLFSLSRDALHTLAAIVGVRYPPSLIFLMGIFFIIVINIHFSTVISKLSNRNKELAQELALLKQSFEHERLRAYPPSPQPPQD